MIEAVSGMCIVKNISGHIRRGKPKESCRTRNARRGRFKEDSGRRRELQVVESKMLKSF